jgi:hypothetical protein
MQVAKYGTGGRFDEHDELTRAHAQGHVLAGDERPAPGAAVQDGDCIPRDNGVNHRVAYVASRDGRTPRLPRCRVHVHVHTGDAASVRTPTV